jgi:hypothetical protein
MKFEANPSNDLGSGHMESAQTKEQMTSVPSGKSAGREGGIKTICALVFVASVLYILIILLKFT